jgi:hypothetical protein
MPKDLLPVGSVVLLNGADKRLMIYGVLQLNPEDGVQYDYLGCLYPEGYVGLEQTYLFNSDDIQNVEFVGFASDEHQQFVERLAQILQESDT